MASRLMHLAACYGLEKQLGIKNKQRFRIGQILPDAVLHADKQKVNTHFITHYAENGKKYKWFDQDAFYDKFKNEITGDELFLGYYFHLIQDNIFRQVIYNKLGLIKRRGDPGLFGELYRDYNILNKRIIKKYRLDSDLQIPQDFSDIKINELYRFDLEEYIELIKTDFTADYDGEPKHFTESVLEGFVNDSVRLCAAEYGAILKNEHALRRQDLSIEDVLPGRGSSPDGVIPPPAALLCSRQEVESSPEGRGCFCGG